jgi:transposase
MYLRTISRTNKDGTTVRYIQLAHNIWDPVKKTSVAKVAHSFGREDQLDPDALQRLAVSINRYLGIDTDDGRPGRVDARERQWRPVASRPAGGGWLLDGIWRQLEIDKTITRLLKGRRLDASAERVLFMLVANRALAPADHKSKLASLTWVTDVALPGVGELGEDPNICYRAMDWLLEIEDELAEAVYWATADLLDLEVDLLLFDTTSTYWETDRADASPGEEQGPTAAAHLPNRDDGDSDDSDGGDEQRDSGFRTYGKSKDHRPDLPQVVVGMAVTRTGIPIRVWSWPGDTGDSPLIRQVKTDLKAWKLGRVVWVADRGFTSAVNRRFLQRGGGHYIMGEKLRHGSKDAQAALKRQGRYKTVADNLQVKEVVLDDATMRDRFVVCRNPDEAQRDAHIRAEIIERLETAIADTDRLSPRKRAELAGRLKTRPAYNRFLRTTPKTGLLRIDRAAIAADVKLDGKFLLRTSDPTLDAEDVALGYKQLLQVERGWRDLKLHLDLRPVFHRREDRIRAHVLLCWLALLLTRIAENAAGDTWRNLRRELHQLAAIESAGPDGTITETTRPTTSQQRIYTACNVALPPRFLGIHPA